MLLTPLIGVKKILASLIAAMFQKKPPNIMPACKISGYSLAEMAISTSIIAMLAVGGLAVMQKKNDSAQAKETLTKLAKIETALKGYIRANGFIPCPAPPASLERDAVFGASVSYDTSITNHICNGGGLVNETGAVPVRTIGLNDSYSYDGWGRKFTYRSASGSGNVADFSNPQFKANIAIIDAKGIAKTNINQPPPYNDGAIYVIISYGANGKNAAYLRNSTATPSGAIGVEEKNTDHTRNIYVQNEKTLLFDDIVIYGTAAKLTPQQIMESPVKIDDKICDTAQSIATGGRSNLNIYVTSASNNAIQNASSNADAIYRSASILANLCKNRRLAETFKPERVSGMAIWLDANDKGTLFTGSDCTTGGMPANNATIGCWKDKSGNSMDFTQTNPASQPKYATNIVNNNNVIDFSEGGYFTSASQVSRNQFISTNGDETTIFFVSKQIDGGGVLFNWATTQNSNRIGIEIIGKLQSFYFPNDSTGKLSGSSDVTTDNHVTTLRRDKFTQSIYMDSSLYASQASPTLSMQNGTSNISLGSYGGSNTLWRGKLAEIMVYKRALSKTERNKVEEYLADKWGIALTSSTSTCQTGMVFHKSANNPQGSCQCPSGQVLIRDLHTANACYTNIVSSTTTSQCVTVNSVPTYSPTPSKGGMVLWLDANDCSTIKIPENNTQPLVSRWADKSGIGNDATQQYLTSRPLYLQGVQNGLPAIRFDGADDKMTVPINISRTSMPSVTISTVYQMRNGGGQGQALWGQDNGQWDRFVMLMDQSTPGLNNNGPSNGAATQLSKRMEQVNTWQILTTSFSYPGTSNAWVNGQSTINHGKGFKEVPGDAGDESITLGNIGSGNNATYPAKVDIGEMIAYNYALSNKQRGKLEAYLSQKWGIMLDATIPQKNINPNTVPGLQLWLDANDSTSLYTGSDCTTGQSPLNGALIGCWADKSGNANNAGKVTNGTYESSPSYVTSAINGNPIIRFNGSSAYLRIGTSLLASMSGGVATGATVFIVATTTTTTSTTTSQHSSIMELYPYTGGIYFNVHLPWYDDSTVYWDNDGASTQTGTGRLTTPWTSSMNDTPNLWTMDSVGTSQMDIWHNGALRATQNTAKLGQYGNSFSLDIGRYNHYSAGYYGFYNGDIAEILIYNTPLSTTTRQEIEEYLGGKWDIKTISGPQLWLDAADASTIYNSIDCTTTKASANGKVGCWKDKSGNAYHAVQETPQNQPSYVYGAAPNPVVRFPGVASGLAVSTNLNITAPYSIYIVTEYYGATQGRILQSANSGTNWALGLVSGKFGYYTASGWVSLNSDSAGKSNWGILAGINDASNAYYYKNGAAPRRSSYVGAPGNIVLGGGAAGNCCVDSSQADIAELIVYNSVLSSSQNDSVNRYLGDKWGVSVP